ncbi:hypothetical protein [Nonomuraea insulae]|uniref:Uncharacterized protein n=1 Tax=Nonomuraea insulae TaxID=1616787 RepID=A0ABW1CD25_9ACTN
MPQTCLPRLTAPVERTTTGTATTDVGVDQSFGWPPGAPFADEGDE